MYLFTKEGLRDLADEEDDLVPGVEDVGTVHGDLLSRELQAWWLRDEVSILVFLNRNNE